MITGERDSYGRTGFLRENGESTGERGVYGETGSLRGKVKAELPHHRTPVKKRSPVTTYSRKKRTPVKNVLP